MWLFFFLFLLFLIVRNLRRFFYRSNLNQGRSLLLIAHPDDESMFFSPLLCNHKNLSILCLSNGDYYKEGQVREKELGSVCKFFDIPYEILNFEDGKAWDIESGVKILRDFLKKNKIENLYTFDHKGITQHINHISCYQMAYSLKSKVNLYTLKTKNTLNRFLLDTGVENIQATLGFRHYIVPFRLMEMHNSQNVWYRKLYTLLSNLTSYNDFCLVK